MLKQSDMTQEDKKLLLKDLCARLPYRIKLNTPKGDGTLNEITSSIFGPTVCVNIQSTYREYLLLNECKPYLRPMSSMTEEEREELKQEHVKDEKLYAECLTRAAKEDTSLRGKLIIHYASDWCNKNHFDYHGLIPMGLALEAPEGMYK